MWYHQSSSSQNNFLVVHIQNIKRVTLFSINSVGLCISFLSHWFIFTESITLCNVLSSFASVAMSIKFKELLEPNWWQQIAHIPLHNCALENLLQDVSTYNPHTSILLFLYICQFKVISANVRVSTTAAYFDAFSEFQIKRQVSDGKKKKKKTQEKVIYKQVKRSAKPRHSFVY